MSRKQRKAAKRRAIRKARKKIVVPKTYTPYDSKCDICGVLRGNETGWKTVFSKTGEMQVCCPNCKQPQEENFTWDDWDED